MAFAQDPSVAVSTNVFHVTQSPAHTFVPSTIVSIPFGSRSVVCMISVMK